MSMKVSKIKFKESLTGFEITLDFVWRKPSTNKSVEEHLPLKLCDLDGTSVIDCTKYMKGDIINIFARHPDRTCFK